MQEDMEVMNRTNPVLINIKHKKKKKKQKHSTWLLSLQLPKMAGKKLSGNGILMGISVYMRIRDTLSYSLQWDMTHWSDEYVNAGVHNDFILDFDFQ